MRVERVGDATEIGKVARQATEQGTERTPLNIQLSRLAKLIGRAGFTIAILTFLIFTGKDLYAYLSVHTVTGWEQWLDIANIVLKYFMMAVTLIVVAVPEGLPMSVTLSLALNMRRMLRTNNLVRKMHACETMGAITVICTDKTGTLTQNLMQVYETQLDETCPDIVAEGIAANSTAFLEEKGEGERPAGVGNPTEVALLLWLQGRGRDYMALRSQARVLDQLTFSTERKYMATLVESPVAGSRVLYVKGAPEIVMSRCTLDEARKREYEEALLAYQNKAMRTLGLAYKVIPADAPTDCAELVAAGGLTFLGIFAISDPIRPDVPDAVRQCQSAGIAVKIVTGDTPGTATEIARQIGLWTPEDTDRNRITGAEFAALSDEERLTGTRPESDEPCTPHGQTALVQLLQQKGAVVAVTGDGTNDAPALNHAQVGLSMGTGTSVAKEASDITLLDDSFRSIATAVMWGRSLYKNIQRFIVFQLTINIVALLSVLLGAFFGTALPLTVTQMLWVNLIMILRRHGAGLHTSEPGRNGREAPQTKRLHHHARHAQRHPRRRHRFHRPPHGAAGLDEHPPRRHGYPPADGLFHRIRHAAILEPLQRRRLRHRPLRLPGRFAGEGTALDRPADTRRPDNHRHVRRRSIPDGTAAAARMDPHHGRHLARAVGRRGVAGRRTGTAPETDGPVVPLRNRYRRKLFPRSVWQFGKNSLHLQAVS